MMTRHQFQNAVPCGVASVELPRYRSPLAAVFIVGTAAEAIDRVRVVANAYNIYDCSSGVDEGGERIPLCKLMAARNGLRDGSSFVIDFGGALLDTYEHVLLDVWLTEHARTDTCLEAVAIWAGSAT